MYLFSFLYLLIIIPSNKMVHSDVLFIEQKDNKLYVYDKDNKISNFDTALKHLPSGLYIHTLNAWVFSDNFENQKIL